MNTSTIARRTFLHRLTLVIAAVVPFSAGATIIVDPSGSYEAQCGVGPIGWPARCVTGENSPPERARGQLFTTGYEPKHCTGVTCEYARTLVEGQLTLIRTYVRRSPSGLGGCYSFPPQRYHLDTYDVAGEILWSNDIEGHNGFTLRGQMVSDPGPATYYPKVKLTGKYLVAEGSNFYTDLERACASLAGTPALYLQVSADGPSEPPPEDCQTEGGLPLRRECWALRGGAIPGNRGQIEGRAYSILPNFTPSGDEVHHADVVLYEQKMGRVRPKSPSESDVEYGLLLEIQGRQRVGGVRITRDSSGAWTFDEPGRFRFSDVPTFRFQQDGGGRWGTVWYTVEVEWAETDERIPQDEGDPELSIQVFKKNRVTNVRPGDPFVQIGLDSFGSPESKIQLTESLTEHCPLHYGPVEADARQFVQNVSDGLTEELEEAIRRGYWAEQAASGGVKLADELVEMTVSGIALLIAELFDDFNKFHRQDIARLRDARDRLKKPPALGADAWGLDTGFDKTIQNALSGAGPNQVLAQSDLASIVKKAIKSLRPQLVFQLQAHGHPDAAKAADNIVLLLSVLCDAIETRTKAGTGKSFVKMLVVDAVDELKPMFVDQTPLSYCADTQESLQRSVDRMSTWSSANAGSYANARAETVQIISEMDHSGGNALVLGYGYQQVARAFDSAEDVFSTIGVAVKGFKIAEKVAQVAKYIAGAVGVVHPFVEVVAVTPDYVDEAVYAAYGQAAPLAKAATATTSPTSATSVIPNDAALLAVLADIAGALDEDRLDDVATLLADPQTASFIAARDAYEREVSALFAQASALAAGADIEVVLRSATDARMAVRTADAELSDRVARIITDAWSGEYSGVADESYLRNRRAARSLVAILMSRLDVLRSRLSSLRSSLQLNGFSPVLLVEAMPPVSETTGETLVQSSPETFTFRARVTNLGEAGLSGLSASLTVSGAHQSVTLGPASELPVGGGTLQPFDGIGNGGADEATVEWTVTYTGDFSYDLISLGVKILEDGQEPAGFSAADASSVLRIDASVTDQDGDTMPDDYEIEHGLDPLKDDSRGDLDDDDLANLIELELGTDPSDPDTDGDGLRDGAEVVPIAGTFGTDPLLADTDGDGVSDSDDGAPVDAGSMTPPEDDGEPSVKLSETLVVLSPSQTLATVVVTNSGGGELSWAATHDSPSLVETRPTANEARVAGDLLFIAADDGFDFGAVSALVTTVSVTDVAGETRDRATVKVILGSDPGYLLCGHGTNATIGSSPTTSDALFALRASVGSAACDSCRCDVDSSGSVSASDALQVLRAAVGLPVTLDCPPC